MIVAKLPFKHFLELLRRSGRERGFIFLVIFIAREADCPQIFRQIERTWASLHDLTGSEILFLTIDGTSSSPSPMEGQRQPRLRDDVGFINSSRGSIVYSPECRLLQRIEGTNSQYSREFIDSNTRPTRRDASWRDEQTLGISPLLDVLEEVQEDDIPCLYFESLLNNHHFTVPIKSINDAQLSIYELLKATFTQSKPFMFEMRKMALSRNDLWKSIHNLNLSIQSLKTKPLSSIEKIIYTKSWLENWGNSHKALYPEVIDLINRSMLGQLKINEVYSGISHLKASLNSGAFSDLRSHLNRIVDCRNLLEEIEALVNIESTNQVLIEIKKADIQGFKAEISELENSLNIHSLQSEHVIRQVILDSRISAQNRIRQVIEEPKRIIYVEKYFEKVEDGYHENYVTTENNTKVELQVMSGDRHINTGGGNYIESNSGVYIQGDYINMSQDLAQAATQIQDLIEQLRKKGVAVNIAQEKVADDMANQAQSNLTIKNKLLKWGQSLGDVAVSDVVKGAVKLAIRSAGIPLP